MFNETNKINIDTDLMSFLYSHKIHKDKTKIKPTHTALPGHYKPGTYFVPDEELENLNQLIADHIFTKKLPLHLSDTQKVMHITEKPEPDFEEKNQWLKTVGIL
jgi:hypothetical protein